MKKRLNGCEIEILPNVFLARSYFSPETIGVNRLALFPFLRSILLSLLGFWFAENHSTFAQGYKPSEVVEKMTVADRFKVNLVASELMIAQPVCIEFGDHGASGSFNICNTQILRD